MTILPYDLTFANPVDVFRGDVPFRLESKRGFLIKIERDSITSYGDVSPLAGQNSLLYKEALAECKNINTNAIFADIEEHLSANAEQFTKEKFLDFDFSQYAKVPALKFALSCLFSDYFRKKLSIELKGAVKFQGLIYKDSSLTETLEQALALEKKGFHRAKIKIGRGFPRFDLENENKILSEILNQTNLILRLDANRKLHLIHYETLLKNLNLDRIEFVEEPVRHSPELLKFTNTYGLNIAIDENINLMKDITLDGVNAVILKPTLIGDYYTLRKFIERFKKQGASSILSSSFESQLGVFQLAQLALAMNPEETHGLDTFNAFLEELVEIETDSDTILVSEEIKLKGPLYV